MILNESLKVSPMTVRIPLPVCDGGRYVAQKRAVLSGFPGSSSGSVSCPAGSGSCGPCGASRSRLGALRVEAVKARSGMGTPEYP